MPLWCNPDLSLHHRLWYVVRFSRRQDRSVPIVSVCANIKWRIFIVTCFKLHILRRAFFFFQASGCILHYISNHPKLNDSEGRGEKERKRYHIFCIPRASEAEIRVPGLFTSLNRPCFLNISAWICTTCVLSARQHLKVVVTQDARTIWLENAAKEFGRK